MLGTITSRGCVPQVHSEQNNTRHTKFSIIPCDVTQHCTANSLRKSSKHCRSPTPHTIPRQGFVQTRCSHTMHDSALSRRVLLTPHCTLHGKPTRRPYTTSRPQFTQSNTLDNPHVVQSTNHCSPLNGHTQSTFQLVFQVRIPNPCRYTDSSHKCQCAAATRRTAMKRRRLTTTMQRTQSNTLVHEVPTNVPLFLSGRFRSLPHKTISSLFQLNQRA